MQDLNNLIQSGEYNIENSLNVPLEVVFGIVDVKIRETNKNWITQTVLNDDISKNDYTRYSADGGKNWSNWSTGVGNSKKLDKLNENITRVADKTTLMNLEFESFLNKFNLQSDLLNTLDDKINTISNELALDKEYVDNLFNQLKNNNRDLSKLVHATMYSKIEELTVNLERKIQEELKDIKDQNKRLILSNSQKQMLHIDELYNMNSLSNTNTKSSNLNAITVSK